MNFVDRELVDGVRYVYPANRASPMYCDGGTIAYVFRGGGSPTTRPVCSSVSEAFSKRCAVDPSGRYFVYLCEIWDTLGEMGQISSLVHEAAHHFGPRDVTYSSIATQKLSQSDQLNNAANYQYFAQDVAQTAYGNPGTLPTIEAQEVCKETDKNCAYYKSLGYCTTQESIQKQCSYTCGFCDPFSTQRKATSNSCRDKDTNCGYYQSLGFCASVENIRQECKQTCGLCSSSSSCKDDDGSCAHYTAYCSADHIRAACKKTCGVC
jgi:hypothetical protein